MTRIRKAFQNKKAFIAFVTGGRSGYRDDRGADSEDGSGRCRFD